MGIMTRRRRSRRRPIPSGADDDSKRHHRHRPDRHRQDRELRAADDRHSGPWPRRARMPRSLILEPTRELAAQVAENFEKYGKYHKLTMALLIGGVSMGDQVKALEKGVDVLIATPGRLMDLFEPRQDPAHRLRACWSSTKPTACSTWASSPISRISAPSCPPRARRCCFRRPCRRRSRSWRQVPVQPQIYRSRTPGRIERQHHPVLVPVAARKQARGAAQPAARSETSPTRSSSATARRRARAQQDAQAARLQGGEIHGDMDQSTASAELDRFKIRRDQHPRRLRCRRARPGRQGRQPRLQLTCPGTTRTTMSTASAAPAAPAPAAPR
jgi:hypothetical protein